MKHPKVHEAGTNGIVHTLNLLTITRLACTLPPAVHTARVGAGPQFSVMVLQALQQAPRPNSNQDSLQGRPGARSHTALLHHDRWPQDSQDTTCVKKE